MSAILAATVVSVVIISLILAAILSAVINSVPEVQEARGGPQGRYDKIFGEDLPAGYGIIDMPMKTWDPDGTDGATQAVTGTTTQWMGTTLEFAKDTAIDYAFRGFHIPPDFSTDENWLRLILLINANETDKTKKSDWNGTVRRVPTTRNESDYAVVADDAGTALTAVEQVTDDTPLEVYTVNIDLGGVLTFKHLDWVQVSLYNDIAGCDLGNNPFVHSSFCVYKK